MADKNWQTGSKGLIPARVVICFAAAVLPCAPASALSDKFAPASYVGSLDPNVLWEILIGAIVVAAFIAAIALWVHSALRKVKRSQVRRTAYISSALNSLSHGVVMTDPKQRIIYCNDRYLEIYRLERSDLPAGMTGKELLALRRARHARLQRRGILCPLQEPRGVDLRSAQRQIDPGQALRAAERRLGRDP
jgi:hypothetical protein